MFKIGFNQGDIEDAIFGHGIKNRIDAIEYILSNRQEFKIKITVINSAEFLSTHRACGDFRRWLHLNPEIVEQLEKCEGKPCNVIEVINVI